MAINGLGGALYISFTQAIYLSGVQVIDNIARHGAGIFINTSATVDIISTKVNRNRALSIGGGLVIDSAKSVHISNSSFRNNEANTFGGAVALHDILTKLTITDSRFIDNKALFGSALVLSSIPIDSFVGNNIFVGNVAFHAGTVHWLISSGMVEPVGLATNNIFDSNVCKMYGCPLSTDIVTLYVDQRVLHINDYDPSKYPLSIGAAFADYYGNIASNENEVRVEMLLLDRRKASCDMNRDQVRLVGNTISTASKGVAILRGFSAERCVPGNCCIRYIIS
jgi:hypothetical protein